MIGDGRHGSARRGVATLFAVFMLTLIGVALASVSALMVSELRRTHATAEEAQLRQALLAGEALVLMRLHAEANEPGEPLQWTLPESGGMTVRAPAGAAGGREVTLEARLGDAAAVGVLRVYLRADGRWVVTSREMRRLR